MVNCCCGRVKNILLTYSPTQKDQNESGTGLILCERGNLWTFCDLFVKGQSEFVLSGVESISRLADNAFAAVSLGGCLYSVELGKDKKYTISHTSFNILDNRGRIAPNKEHV